MSIATRIHEGLDSSPCSQVSPWWRRTTNTPLTPADLMAPAQLNSQLAAVKSGKIVLIQVGFHVMYQMAHIPGSQYAGAAASRRRGLAA